MAIEMVAFKCVSSYEKSLCFQKCIVLCFQFSNLETCIHLKGLQSMNNFFLSVDNHLFHFPLVIKEKMVKFGSNL